VVTLPICRPQFLRGRSNSDGGGIHRGGVAPISDAESLTNIPTLGHYLGRRILSVCTKSTRASLVCLLSPNQARSA